MPLKLSAGLTKKVGLPNYGSLGAACHVELELDSALLQSPAALQAQVSLAYDVCRRAVEAELCREPVDSVEPVSGHINGHVEQTEPATDRQINYSRQLAQEIPSIGWQALDSTIERRFEKPIAQLTKSEASRIIERLLKIKAGHLQPPSLWEVPIE